MSCASFRGLRGAMGSIMRLKSKSDEGLLGRRALNSFRRSEDVLPPLRRSSRSVCEWLASGEDDRFKAWAEGEENRLVPLREEPLIQFRDLAMSSMSSSSFGGEIGVAEVVGWGLREWKRFVVTKFR
jgi:hypothetical protein